MTNKNVAQTEAHAYAIMLLTAPKFNHVDVHKIEHNKKECFYGVITSDGPSTKMFKYDPPIPVIEPDTIGWVTCPGSKELRVLHSQEGQKYIVYGPGQFRIGPTYGVPNFTPLTEKDLNIKKDDKDNKGIDELERLNELENAIEVIQATVESLCAYPINKPFGRKTECINCDELQHGMCPGNGPCEDYKDAVDTKA